MATATSSETRIPDGVHGLFTNAEGSRCFIASIKGKFYTFSNTRDNVWDISGHDGKSEYYAYVRSGRVLRCDCPHAHFRKLHCKHMRVLQEYLDNEQAFWSNESLHIPF